MDAKRYAEADAPLRRATGLRETLLGEAHPLTAEAWLGVAEIAVQLGAADAPELAARGLALAERSGLGEPKLAEARALRERAVSAADD